MTLEDEFAYLADPDDPLTRRCIDDETRYFNACMASVARMREQLYSELKSRIVEDDVSVPETIGRYRYYTRFVPGMQYPVHCRARKELDAPEETYLDENRLAAGTAYCDVSTAAICPRQKHVACAVDRTGDERYEVLVAPIPGGEPRCIASGTGDSIAWSGDGRCVFYTGVDDNARPDSVWVHDLDRGTAVRILSEPDPAYFITLCASRSGQWILIDVAGNSCSETWVLPSDSPAVAPRLLFARRDDIEYTVEHHGDRFLVLTNDEAENFRLVAIPAPWDGSGAVVELVAAQERVCLEFVDPYRNHLVIGQRKEGVREVWVWNLAKDTRHFLPVPESLRYLDVEDLYDYEADFVRFEYSTPTRPHSVYDYDVASAALTQRKTSSPPGYDEDEYATERWSVPSGEVEVPLTLIYRKDALVVGGTGGNPLLLTGYGAYEEPLDTEFDSDLVSLLDRGVVAAMAHVRGGGDLGPAWHDAGRLANKENSFADLLACARFLIGKGYTAAGRIALQGASAGGLLAAVAVLRAPELFSSAVLEVPFLDVLNTLLDRELPLTEYDFDEFGNPAVEEEFQWIRGYSPYDNIGEHDYPPMLLTTAMNDQRVGYWEALKWSARLRSLRTDDNPLLVKIDDAGHLGESGRYGAVRENSVIYAFLLDMWGLIPEEEPARR